MHYRITLPRKCTVDDQISTVRAQHSSRFKISSCARSENNRFEIQFSSVRNPHALNRACTFEEETDDLSRIKRDLSISIR